MGRDLVKVNVLRLTGRYVLQSDLSRLDRLPVFGCLICLLFDPPVCS
jgi:hypothetical protein